MTETHKGRIEHYALIGDCETAALVARDGSIDWLCWPRFDSGACFAALLGTPEHGRWRLSPKSRFRTSRAYRPDTLILETLFETAQGAVRLTDFMPVRNGASDLVRIVEGVRGRVAMEMELILRFDYGSSVPWVTRLEEGNGIRAVAGPDKVKLYSPVPLEGEDLHTVARFEVGEGDRLAFTLEYIPSHLHPPVEPDPETALAETERFWRDWISRCTFGGEWKEAVCRSLITLKALTYAPTGGIVAAPTTSLPESIGGVRNWDYRYCWLRDATLTLLALMDAGYRDEAAAWRDWLVRAVAGSPAQMQIMYGIAGERRLPELELDWLPGYEGSKPVRTGNAAAPQLQLDVYGEVMDVLHQAHKVGLRVHEPAWDMQRALLEHVERVWEKPDEGIWEVRGRPRHFTYSKVMCWVAFDRAIKGVETWGLPGPVERWRELRARIHADVCARGFRKSKGTFVQSYGSTELDASLLLIPMTGFLPCDDPRVVATVEAIRKELTVGGLVKRYRTRRGLDGLPPGEGVFLACSFWLVDVLCMQERLAEARALFERLLALRNDVGLLAEEYDPHAKRHLGNFPQAFSHVGLISSAMGLSTQAMPAEERAAA
ncbi:MAG TPA: glycoside hydrolase family 15 protein [Burkholderiales bacterium]|nr:glycoside hydrolase family 15 protein [Burkholderiales bacterium]